MNPLDIVVVSFVLAYDGTPISSTRIRKGEINKNGEVIK
jgi:pantetheine-phosphate adenylyltransferase